VSKAPRATRNLPSGPAPATVVRRKQAPLQVGRAAQEGLLRRRASGHACAQESVDGRLQSAIYLCGKAIVSPNNSGLLSNRAR
jgi:hypothetical protein